MSVTCYNKFMKGIENFEYKESFEAKAGRVREEARSEIIASRCTPGKDDEACVDRYFNIFDQVFDRVIEADPSIVDNWETNKEAYLKAFLTEVDAEDAADELKAA
jgi:hypothetical protein